MKTLIQMLIEAGYPKEEIRHDENDLYVCVTPITTKVIDEWCEINRCSKRVNFIKFKDNLTGKLMYDCAFQYNEEELK